MSTEQNLSPYEKWVEIQNPQVRLLHPQSVETAYNALLDALHKLERNPLAAHINQEIVELVLKELCSKSDCTGCGDLVARYRRMAQRRLISA